jgi:hypothetical protein
MGGVARPVAEGRHSDQGGSARFNPWVAATSLVTASGS